MASDRHYLLDANCLIALTFSDHVHHRVCKNWLQAEAAQIGSCAFTQAAFVRVAMRLAPELRASSVIELLRTLTAHPGHLFLVDDVPLTSLNQRGLRGPQQVTDFHLVQLAERHGMKLATLDRALAAVHPTSTILIH